MLRLAASLLLASCLCFGQLDPDGAHVNLYFPHLADGGTSAQQWQTSFVFVNPHPAITARVVLGTYGDDGKSLSLNLGSGPATISSFTIPPSGSRVFRSSIASANIVTGYAIAAADIPVQATVFFRQITNGVPQVEVSAPATLPSPYYFSPATRDLGVALVNVYNVSRSFRVVAVSSAGAALGSGVVNLGPAGHSSFNLAQLIPSLPSNFSGSVQIGPVTAPTDQFVAWTLNVDRGLVATLPSGKLAWPISHFDRIWLVYRKLLAVASPVLTSLGAAEVNLVDSQTVTLSISSDPYN